MGIAGFGGNKRLYSFI